MAQQATITQETLFLKGFRVMLYVSGHMWTTGAKKPEHMGSEAGYFHDGPGLAQSVTRILCSDRTVCFGRLLG